MMNRGRIAAAAILAAVLSALPAAAERAPRRLVVAVEAKNGDAYAASELLQISRSLMAAIQASGAPILLLDWGADPFPSDTPEAVEAVKRTADCWLRVTIGGARRNPALVIQSYDLLLKRHVIEGKLQLDKAFELPDPPAASWQKLADMVAGAYPPLDTDQPLAATPSAGRPALWTKDLAVLTLRAAPGTVVEGLDGDPRTVGEDGTLRESVRSPATYRLTATHPDQLPLQTTFYLEDDREIALEQHRVARWSVDAGLYGLSFPQVEGSYFIVPGWLYARAGVMTYLAGLAFTSEEMFYTSALTTISAKIGTYAFLPPESWVRPYVGAGVLLRIAHAAEFFGIEPVAPVALQLALGVEASPWPRSRFFIEWLPTEYPTPYPDLFAASMPHEQRSVLFLPYAVLDMGGFRLGWRWML